jgi:hypothetical protein
MHDSVSVHALPVLSREQVCAQLTEALAVLPSSAGELAQAVPERRAGRGRPIEVQPTQLWLGLLWAVLEGVHGYRALARFLARHALGRFAPVSLTDSALVQRLQQARSKPLQTLVGQVGSWLQAWLSPPACELAPFASHIIAADAALAHRRTGQR